MPQVEMRESEATFWSGLRDAIRGVHHDFTAGSINRAIFLLAVPMVLEMFMESLFGIVDVFWVAHLGPNAIATVGLTETALTLVFVIAIGLSVGATAVVARRTGEKDPVGASNAAMQGILLGLGVSLVVAFTGSFFASDILRVLGASPEVIRTGSNYTRTIFGGSATVFLIFLINAVFRGAGDAAIAMRVLWLANIVNICLNPCLIFGIGPFPALGVTGSAVGTTIGRGVGVAYQLYVLFTARGRISIPHTKIRVDLDVMKSMVKLSLSAMFQYFVQMASWIGLVRVLAGFSSAAVAANTLAIKIVLFVILPSWGMSNAAATLVGQNLGAGKPERAETCVWRTAWFNVALLGLTGLVFTFFAEPLIGVFTNDPDVVPIAVKGLRLLSYGNISYAMGMVLTAAFNGAGDTFTPTVLNLICFWAVQLPLAYALAVPVGMGPTGAWTAVLVGDTMLAGLAVVLFRQGKWKKVKV
ncbi:MAG: MATE family efflux transporter [Acidobacteriota bacterium]